MNHKLEGKLPHIRQERADWCIPASIEVALKYLCPDIGVTQKELWDLLGGKPPSFGIYREILSNLPKFDSFSFEQWGPGAPNKLGRKLQDSIEHNHPVLISLPLPSPVGGCHIRVCRTVTDDSVSMFDPGRGCDERKTFDGIGYETKNRNCGDILIIGLKS